MKGNHRFWMHLIFANRKLANLIEIAFLPLGSNKKGLDSVFAYQLKAEVFVLPSVQ